MILVFLILFHVIIWWRIGWQGIPWTYVLAIPAWYFWPTFYNGGFSGFLVMTQLMVFLIAIGSLFPRSSSTGTKIAAAGAGGYLIGRWMSKI